MALKEYKSEREHYWINENNHFHGEYKCFHDNGQQSLLCTYWDGTKHGVYKRWHANGNLWLHCYYENGHPHGEYKAWDSLGILHTHIINLNGNRVVNNVSELSDKDKFELTLRHNIKWL